MMKEALFEGLGVMYMLSVIVMIAVIVAMTVDFVSGWRKAKMRGDEHTSYAASRTLTKFLIYEGMLIIGVCMDTMVHFAWAMFMDSGYAVPLLSIAIGIVLCVVEAWSVKEKAEDKARKRIDEAALALAKILDKETVLELLRKQVKETAGAGGPAAKPQDALSAGGPAAKPQDALSAGGPAAKPQDALSAGGGACTVFS